MSAFVRNLKFNNLQFLHFTQIVGRFSSSSTPATEFSSLSEYLSKALGFSEQQSSQICTKLARFWGRNEGEKKVSDFKFAANAFSVVDFLEETGFGDAHIRKVVFSHPRILTSKVDKTLKPKIKVLQDLGFSGVDIVEAMSANYKLFQYGPDSSIVSTILALRQIVRRDSDLVLVIRRAPRIFTCNRNKELATNIAFLESSGISIESIRKEFIFRPSLFLLLTEDFMDLVTRVEKELGILRSSNMFLRGLSMLNGLSETTLKSKYQVFDSFGWTQSDVKALVNVNPSCLNFSEQRLKKSLSFLMKDLGYEPKYLISHPTLLNYGVEKRLIPRHTILSVLKEKGLVRADRPLYSAVKLTESLFVEKYVVPFEEVHKLYTKLTGYSLQTVTNVKDFGSVFLHLYSKSEGTVKSSVLSTPGGQPPGYNVAEMLVVRGLAEAVKHRDFDERSSYYDALLAAESKAIAHKKGKHSSRDAPAHHIQDLTTASAKKAKDLLPCLRRSKRLSAIIDYVHSGNRFKLIIPKESCGIAFSLYGVRCPGRGEPYSEEAIALMRRRILQRDVEIEVETVTRSGKFLGSLWVSRTNVSTLLLQAGLAKLEASFGADRIKDSHLLAQAEESAKRQKLKIWENYVEEQEITNGSSVAETRKK